MSIERNDDPNRFFDESGNELFMNDAENNPNDQKILNKHFEVEDQVYHNLTANDLFGMVGDAGFNAKDNIEAGNYIERYRSAKDQSLGNSADFPNR